MAEDLIKHYIDPDSFAADTKFAIDQLARLEAQYEKLKASFKALQGASLGKNIATSAADANTTITNLTNAINAQTSSLNQNTEATKRQAGATNELAREKQKLANLSSEEAKQAAILKVQQQQQAKANKEAAIETLGLRDAYQRLNAEYLKAAQHAKNMAVIHGVDSRAAKEAAASAKTLSDRLKEIDNNVGQNQRNVGNYTSAFDKLGNAFQSVFNRIIAYASVTAVIDFFSGTVSAAAEAEQEVARFHNTLDGLGRLDAFDRLSDSADAMAERFKYIDNEDVLHVFDQLITYGKLTENQIKDLTPVIINFAAKSGQSLQEAGATIIKAIESGKGLKGYGLDLKDAGSEAERLNLILTQLKDKVDGAADAFGETTQGKIAAAKQQFANLKEEIGDGLLPMFNKVLEGLNGIIQGFRRMAADGIGTVLSRTLRGIRQHITGDLTGFAADQARRQSEDERAKIREQQQREYDEAHIRARGEGDKILGAGGDTGPKQKEKKAQITQLKELLDAEFEIYRVAQSRKIKLLEDAAGDEKLNYDRRISLLNEYSTASIALIDAQLKHDIESERKRAASLQATLPGKTGNERKNVLIEIQNTNAKIAILEAKADAERLAVFDANEKKFTEITDKEHQKRLKIQKDHHDRALKLIDDEAMERKAIIDKEYAEGGAGLQARFDAGNLTQENYNRKKLDLDYAYAVESLQLEIETAKKKIAVGLLTGEDQRKALIELAKLERDLQKASVDHTRESEQEKREHILKTLAAIQKASNEVFGVIDGIFNANIIATKNKLTAQQDDAEKQAAREIERINASADSEEKKAARILVVNARLQAQKDQIAQKEKAAELQKAKFDKAAAIFNIILNTAQAVIKALPNIPLSIAVGALGAAQLAVAIATPIPKYKHGKTDSYEGPAIVGDGGKQEVIKRKDGSFELTPAHDTLTHIGREDIVYPDINSWMKSLAMPAVRGVSEKPGDHLSKIEDTLKKQTPLLQQIANKRENHLSAKEGALVSLWKHGANTTKYIDENTNWS